MANKITTKQIVGTAIFSALAFVVSILEFPIFPATNFLKLDFSLAFILLCGFLFGTVYGICASFVKEIFRFIFFSTTGGIGEIANFIITVGFIIVPTLVYSKKKGFKIVVITLIIGSLIEWILALLSNRFIMFPLYMGENAGEFYYKTWYFILLFNVIKTTAISLLTIVLYKRLSNLIRKI